MTDDRNPDERSTSTLLNLARGAKGIALLCFLLPWVTISCGDNRLIRASGADLATGNVRPEEGAEGVARLGKAADTARSVFVDPFALEAATLLGFALVLTFMLPRFRAALAALVATALAGALVAWDGLVQLPRMVAKAAGGDGTADRDPAAQLLNQFMPQITVRAEYGFWLTLAAIAAAAILLAIVAARTRERRPSA